MDKALLSGLCSANQEKPTCCPKGENEARTLRSYLSCKGLQRAAKSYKAANSYRKPSLTLYTWKTHAAALHREVVDTPSLEAFKDRLGGTLGSLIWIES